MVLARVSVEKWGESEFIEGGSAIARKGYKPEQIVHLHRRIEVETANGKKAALAASEERICEQTYHAGGRNLTGRSWSRRSGWRNRKKRTRG